MHFNPNQACALGNFGSQNQKYRIISDAYRFDSIATQAFDCTNNKLY